MKIKSVSSLKLIKFLSKKEFFIHHKRGSHFVLYKKNFGRIVVPERNELPIGTLRAILREAKITRKEYVLWVDGND